MAQHESVLMRMFYSEQSLVYDLVPVLFRIAFIFSLPVMKWKVLSKTEKNKTKIYSSV